MNTGIINPNEDQDVTAQMSLSEAKEKGAILMNQMQNQGPPDSSKLDTVQLNLSIINRAQAILKVNEAERFKA